MVADDSFRDQICGRLYGSVETSSRSQFQEKNSQKSLAPTPINPTKTIPQNTAAASSTGKNGHVRISDRSDHWERQASNVRNLICINDDVLQAYRKYKRKTLILLLQQATTAQYRHGQSRGLSLCCRLLHFCSIPEGNTKRGNLPAVFKVVRPGI